MPSTTEIKERLKKIEGQVKGLQRMIDERRPCEEILTQCLAACAALDQVAAQVVLNHIEDCLANRPLEEAKSSIGRALQLLRRFP
ncbi:MAG: metal-sensitive transcriptional regulator [Chloroflexi bacterium]|nr:metal-sensitive transcriptional regulator [Chloroflexota bacterium]MCL5074751.1 metal-sensitive transcriptional regulator [Chloroflexota bacterium]